MLIVELQSLQLFVLRCDPIPLNRFETEQQQGMAAKRRRTDDDEMKQDDAIETTPIDVSIEKENVTSEVPTSMRTG